MFEGASTRSFRKLSDEQSRLRNFIDILTGTRLLERLILLPEDISIYSMKDLHLAVYDDSNVVEKDVK